MQRRAATALHLALFGVGAALYIVFVIPRWWVLTGDLPNTAAMVGRIAAGLPIAAAAVPIMLNLRRALQPGFRTPELALRMQAWSAVLHIVAGALIVLAAVAETLLSLDAAGPWLFAVYGAAAAIALLGFAAFHLSRVAEKPPAEAKAPQPDKPPKEKRAKRRGRKRGSPTEDAGDSDDTLDTEDSVAEAPEVSEDSETSAPNRDAEVVETQLDGTEVVEIRLAETDAREIDTVEADTVETDTVETDTVETDTVETDTVETDTVETDTIETDTIETDTAPGDTAPGDTGIADTEKTGGLRNKRPTGKRRRLPR